MSFSSQDYSALQRNSYVLPDYEDPETARQHSPQQTYKHSIVDLHLSQDNIDEYVRVDWSKVLQNEQLFYNLLNKIEKCSETKDEELKEELIQKLKLHFGPNKSVTGKKVKKINMKDLEGWLDTKQQKPKSKKKIQEEEIDNSHVRIRKKFQKNFIKIRKKPIRVVFHLEDINFSIISDRLSFGTATILKRKEKFIILLESLKKSSQIKLKPSIVEKLEYISIPKKKLTIFVKPIFLSFRISRKYRYLIFIIDKLLSADKNQTKTEVFTNDQERLDTSEGYKGPAEEITTEEIEENGG